MSDTTVDRWKENQPLTHRELLWMRLGIAWRLFLAFVLLGFVACALCGCKTTRADGYKFPSFSGTAKTELGRKTKADPVEESFDGVTIVVAVERLTEFAPDLRKRVALEADRVFRDLAKKKLKGHVRTRLIAEVAEPNVFRNYEAAAMDSARPVLVHVLVPAQNTSLVQSTIREKIEELISAHFLQTLKKYRLLVTFERLDPDAYAVALNMASMREVEPEEDPDFGPEINIDLPKPTSNNMPPADNGLMVTMLTAWLTERSKLIGKAVSYYRTWKGLA